MHRRTGTKRRTNTENNESTELTEKKSQVKTNCAERGKPANSDDDGFLVLAEDAAESGGDFTDGGVAFDGGENSREKILGGGGAALELGEGRLDAGGIAFGAKGIEPRDL